MARTIVSGGLKSGALVASRFDLEPGANVSPLGDAEPGTWRIQAPQAELIIPGPFPAGWYRAAIKVRALDRFTIRKKGEFYAELASRSSPPARLGTIEWNRSLNEELFFELPNATDRLRWTLCHAEGDIFIDRLDIESVGPIRTLVRALRMKLHLLRAYKNFWPVAWKGGRLLFRGSFSEVYRRILKGLTDAHTLRLETREASEVDAALWRRQTISSERIAEIRMLVARMVNPPSVAVIIPVDAGTLEPARLAIYSVLRQIYPHWQLLVACPTAPVPQALHSAARGDSRVRFILPGAGDRLGESIRRALKEIPCDHALVLRPDWELREHALFHLADEVARQNAPSVVTCDTPEPPRSIRNDPDDDTTSTRRRSKSLRWSTSNETKEERIERLRRQPRFGLLPKNVLNNLSQLPTEPTAEDVSRWFESLFPPVEEKNIPHINQILAAPLDGGSLLAREGIQPAAPSGPPFFLSGNLVQISGYDHLVFALLKGLRSLGVNVHRHPMAIFRNDLIPIALRPPSMPRASDQPQLVVTAPFIVNRYRPDTRTAVYTMWESEWLDPSWVCDLNEAVLILVPTTWVARVFKANGVTAPIEVAPLGTDPVTFHPGADFPDCCVFGTAGALDHGGLRKNVQRVIDLFRQAFPDKRDVKLRVKITPTSPMVNTYGDPRIDVVSTLLTHGELADWYRSLTAYVNASYAEGFGLHLLEAMACGRPLISTAYSGVADYFDDTVGYVVRHRLIECNNEIYRGLWGDPDDADIINHMRSIYAQPTDARHRGQRAAHRARLFTWRDCGRRVLQILTRHGFIHDPSLAFPESLGDPGQSKEAATS